MSALLVLAAAATSPQPGALRTFKDWTAGCDNGRACQAVGLLAENEVEGPMIAVQLGAAADSVPRIKIAGEAKAAGLSIGGARSTLHLRARRLFRTLRY